jgi:hypothetical protein
LIAVDDVEVVVPIVECAKSIFQRLSSVTPQKKMKLSCTPTAEHAPDFACVQVGSPYLIEHHERGMGSLDTPRFDDALRTIDGDDMEALVKSHRLVGNGSGADHHDRTFQRSRTGGRIGSGDGILQMTIETNPRVVERHHAPPLRTIGTVVVLR